MKSFYIETYGCQMNVSDSQVVAALLAEDGYQPSEKLEDADIILVNTCSIRDNAEQRIWGRLDVFRQLKKQRPALQVGVLGCMASRLKDKLLEDKVVNFVVGPDSYRTLPSILSGASLAVQTQLSKKETYADIFPLRSEPNGVSTFVSIMRGCNNMCAYCVVPYVRGAERSRDPQSIEQEVRTLVAQGYKEVNLLGQNVDSYFWQASVSDESPVTFAVLLDRIAGLWPQLRIRFATSHPKDMSDALLHTMAAHPNICRHIHLPVQSGSNKMLDKMNRKYTRQTYLQRVAAIRALMPDCVISTDMIAGFCGESLEDHADSLSLMQEVGFDQAYLFQYSERPNTYAARHYQDDVPEAEKTRRLNELIALQNELSLISNRKDVGKEFEILVEGPSKRSDEDYFGRTSGNKVCVFARGNVQVGDFVRVRVVDCSSATLKAELI